YGDGIITANTLMSYTYEHVAKDAHSNQTPHFGFLEGDGDFIFQAPILESLAKEEEKGKDILIEIPATTAPAETEAPNLPDLVKDLLADNKHRIRLHDTVVSEIRKVMAATNEDRFPVQTKDVTAEEFAERLGKYEATMHDMIEVMLCLSHWGEGQQISLIRKCISRLTDHFKATGGRKLWLSLRWYPSMLLTYTGGLGAISAGRYSNLAAVFLADIPSLLQNGRVEPAILVVNQAALELTRMDAFKRLPGHEKQYVPRSEYLFKVLQPIIDDTLFVGKAYEALFDRYEVLQALVYADLHEKEGRRVWGPIGRFGWKNESLRSEENPFAAIVEEANEQKSDWPPFKAGLFQGSYERFTHIASEYGKILQKLNWW
ncbi:MAG: caspase family protein, partial [Planctomycetota bacterium]